MPTSEFTAVARAYSLTDRVDAQLNSIKGGGACQLREKVLADMSDVWVTVADFRKNSEILGQNVSTPQCMASSLIASLQPSNARL